MRTQGYHHQECIIISKNVTPQKKRSTVIAIKSLLGFNPEIHLNKQKSKTIFTPQLSQRLRNSLTRNLADNYTFLVMIPAYELVSRECYTTSRKRRFLCCIFIIIFFIQGKKTPPKLFFF